METVRADHLGIYGYPRNTSPNIDSFYGNGIVFMNAFTQAPNTLPSHMSIFTGLYPSHHGVIDVNSNESLSNNVLTIAQILKLYNYSTATFYSGSVHLDPRFGFSRGFDKYESDGFVFNETNVFDYINETKNERFFIFMHTDISHDPYLALPPFTTMFDNNYSGKIISDIREFRTFMATNNVSENDTNGIRSLYWSQVNGSDPRDIQHLIAMYDSRIYKEDMFMGDLFNYLRSLKLLNNTIIIITSGTGEEFGEHGGFRDLKLYDETLHIPFLAYVPDSKPEKVYGQVGNIDVMPTILSLLGKIPPANIDGKSLIPLIENQTNEIHPELFSEFVFEKAIRTTEWKLIKTYNKTVNYELFNLKNDPKEHINLDGKGIAVENYLISQLEDWEKTTNSTYENIEFVNSTFIGYP